MLSSNGWGQFFQQTITLFLISVVHSEKNSQFKSTFWHFDKKTFDFTNKNFEIKFKTFELTNKKF